ncbi:P-loop containing nucleoside triphosphate hydrolase protein [Neocallimastix lanati (nom. inval.)]|jgi:ATP-binding cassette subfamily B protein|nr:P-loop containing nucleoside triphosphate hydrolase protein [Neocallimastix sp. JGI-2020a]
MDFEEKYQFHLKKYTKTGISRLLEMSEEKKFLLIISSIISVIGAICSLVPFISVYKILEVLLRNYVYYSNHSRDEIGTEEDSAIMIKWGLIAVGSHFLSIMFTAGSLGFSHIAAFETLYNIRVRISEHIGFLPLGYLTNTTTGSISKTMEQNVENIELFIAHTIPDIVKVGATVVFAVAVFMHYNVILTIICLVTFIIAVIFQFSSMFFTDPEVYRNYYDITEKIGGTVVQFVNGIPAVKIFGKTIFSFHKLVEEFNKQHEIALRICKICRSGYCLFLALIESFSVFVIPVGLFLLSKNEKDMAMALDYIFFIIMSPGLATPLFSLIMLVSNLETTSEGNKRIDNILNQDITKEPEHPKIPTKLNVTFNRVTFNYDESEKSKTTDNVLDDVSFEAENGKITALVGPSGSGKSTIGNLIPRFWDVKQGEVCIGGINVKDIKYEDLMNIVSFVFQDTFLFNDTIYENIAVGKPNVTKEEVIAASKAAQCHEFIENLPDKYQTVIGSNEDKEGVLLSGGEKQRICIARAILKNSPILVLDEATAYADPENEYNIQLALKELIKNKTVIVIAHNLNTIKSADNIIVINKGKIVEQGNHDQLLKKNGTYSKMWDAYINSSKWFISNKDDTDSISMNNPVTIDTNTTSDNNDDSKVVDPRIKPRSGKVTRKEGMFRDNFNILYNITYGHPEKVYKGIFYTIISNVVNVVPFFLNIMVIQTVFDAFDGSNNPLNTTKIWIISGILVAYILVMYLFELPAYDHSYGDAYLTGNIGRMELAEHIRRLPLGTIYDKDPGEMANILSNDFNIVETATSHYVPNIFGGFMLPIISFIFLIFVDWRLALAAFIPFPLGFLILIGATTLQDKLSLNRMKAKVNASVRIQEYMNGIRCIKAYNLIGKKFQRLEQAFRKLKEESIKLEVGIGPLVCLTSSITQSGLSIMIITGAYLLKNNEISVSTFVTFLVIGSHAYDPLIRALNNIAELRYSAVAGKRIGKFLDLPLMGGTTKVNYGPKKDIVFSHVSFKYHDEKKLSNTKSSQEYTLNDINLTMKQGTMTALVGPSGSGKTTILKLISRFYDCNEGTITFAGEDISQIDPEFYMKNISIVFQDVYLFKDTIANNIGFGKSNPTMEEIIDAAKKACAHDFIMSLPNGYDTMVGEGGCTLSGGEKQRISIARAVLKNAPVVLLDEATSSLDPENEVEVQKAISDLIKGRTVIVISHHLKTIKEADNIVVLDNGSVVEQGKHDQLIENNKLYRRLWDVQEKYKGWTMN